MKAHAQPRPIAAPPNRHHAARSLSAGDLAAVERLLRVVLDPFTHETIDGWREEVLRALMQLLGADKAAFLMPVRGRASFHTVNNPSHLVSEYPSVIQPLDREISVWERQARLGAFDRQTLWRGHERTLLASPYYNEFVIPNRLHHATGLTARLSGPASASTSATIWVHHDRDSGRTFGQRGLAILGLLTPAVGAAVRTLQRLDEHRETLTRTIDALGIAAVVFELDGRTVHETPTLTRLLAGDPDRAVVMRAAQKTAQSLVPIPDLRTSYGRYHTEAVLSGNRLADVRPRVIVMVTAIRSAGVPTEFESANAKLRDDFGLTPRELEVARLIANGSTVGAIATTLGISRHTARHHVERVFVKLNVHTLIAACAVIRGAMRAD